VGFALRALTRKKDRRVGVPIVLLVLHALLISSALYAGFTHTPHDLEEPTAEEIASP
jgi:hypothetical protein